MSFSIQVDDELELRQPELHLADVLYEAVDRNREHIGRWLAWVDGIKSVDDERAWIKSSLQGFAEGNQISTLIFERGQLIGGVGTLPIHPQEKQVEIGYWLVGPAQGRGVMTRACAKLTDYLLTQRGLKRITIRTAVGNDRSEAIPLRLGYQKEGLLRQAGWTRDGFVDLKLYAMLAQDWPHQGAIKV